MDTMAWRATLLVSCLWHGDGFVWVPSRDAQGQPVAPLFVLNPTDVEVQEYDTDQRVRGYWVNVGGGRSVRLGPEEIIHVRGMAPIIDGRGQGVLASHLESWREAVAQRDYAQGLYSAGIPAGYLKTSAPNLTEPQAEALKAKWMENHGSTRRSIAVLNAVTEFHPIQMPPEAAQMVEAKRLSILDVANAFGVEPYMLGLPSDGSTYANIQDRMVSFARFTLLPWARRVEEALSREFPTGTNVHLDLDSLARANSADRGAYYAQGLAEGWLTVDEVREAEGLPPLPSTPTLATVTPAVRSDTPAIESDTQEEIPA
jgi:HK97 family phage portal protein